MRAAQNQYIYLRLNRGLQKKKKPNKYSLTLMFLSFQVQVHMNL